MIGGTKGSHILLEHEELRRQLAGRMIYFEAADGRICLVYDYLGKVMVGSTDIPTDDPDDVKCEDEEIEYFLDCLHMLLPSLAFDRSQILYSYSGIRPLPASNSSAPGLISRDHSAPVNEPAAGRPFPIISLVGGKWTTFRGFAEEVTDTILARLRQIRRTSTRELAIGGGKHFPQDTAVANWLSQVSRETSIPEKRVAELLTRYGTTAREIARHCGQSDYDARLPDAPDTSLAEIDWIARNERVVHLQDIVMRRTTLAVIGALTTRNLAAVAVVVGNALGWEEQRRAKEVVATADLLNRVHGTQL
jgi:glycerol-3-phosphate dehydrogenase